MQDRNGGHRLLPHTLTPTTDTLMSPDTSR